jgi:AcrR family transcriptional regulator
MTLATEHRRGSGSRDFARRREAVLDAATAIINDQGLDALNLESVAEVLDLKYQALYYYFDSKEHLACEAFLRSFGQRSAELERVREEHASALEALLAFLNTELAAGRSERVRLSAMYALSETALETVQAARAQALDLMTGLVVAGIDDGSLAPCHPRTRALAIEGVLERFVTLGHPSTRDAVTRQTVEIITQGALMPGQRLPAAPRDNVPIETVLHYDRDLQDPEFARMDEVLRTATIAFNLRGASGTSIPEVARSMGVSKSVFYGYAEDKEELLYQCYLRGALMIDIAQRMAVVMARDPVETIVLGYSYIYRAHGSAVGPIPVFNSLGFLSPPHRRVIGIRYRALSLNARNVMKEGEQSGHFRPGAEVVHRVFSSLLTTLPRWYTEDYPLSLDEIAAEILRFVLLGLAPR